MLKRMIITSLLFAFSAEASHLDTVCKSATTNPPVFSENFLARKNLESKNVIENFEGKEIYEFHQKMISLVDTEKNIWALTRDGLIELSLTGEELNTYDIGQSKAMTLAGNLLLIVRSGGTISAFDIEKKEMAWTSYMQEISSGLAITIAYDGQKAYVSMATAHEGGFTGVAVIDPKTGKVLSKTPYDVRRSGVISVFANSHWYQDKLILNNMGWIHVMTAKQLASSKPMRPRWVAHKMNPKEDPHYMMLQGEFFMENDHVVGCGSYREKTENGFEHKTALFKVKLP